MKKYFYIVIFILLIIFFCNNIFFTTNKFILIDEDRNKIETTFIHCKDILRFRIIDSNYNVNNSLNFITIDMNEKIIGVNNGIPKQLFRSIFFFSQKNKMMNILDSDVNLKVNRDSILFNGFTYYNVVIGDSAQKFTILYNNYCN